MLKQFAYSCAALIALACAPVAASAQDRFALVIGNSNYKNASPLANPARDAGAVGSLLRDSGFQVTSALDLDKAGLSKVIRFFTNNVAEKPENTVVLIYFAGHGVQVDGENFLVPVDATIAREADVPLEALRLADLMTMLESVRSKTRIVILDACRDNPFGDIAKTAPRGLALVNAPAGTLLAYSTSPGHTADDGTGSNSPFAQALMKSAREPGLPIEAALKNVRLAVHGATGGRQTPWEVSALTEPFSFFPGPNGSAAAPVSGRTADQLRKELQSKPPRDAFAIAVRENDVVVYEQYLSLYGNDPLASGLRSILDRRLMMLAWQEAVALNTEAAFAEFLARYPNSDLSATARRLQQRARARMAMASVLGGARDANLIRAAVPGGTCPCAQPAAPNQPANPGSPPSGTRASIPVSPGVSSGIPTGPRLPLDPVVAPSGPVYVPVVPIIPPRIREPIRIRDPHRPDYPRRPGDRGSGKTDHTRPDAGRGAGKPEGPRSSGNTRPGRDADIGRPSGRNGGGRIGNRGRDAGRIPPLHAAPRIPRTSQGPGIQAPRFQPPPRGGGIRMGGPGPRFGGRPPSGGNRGGFNLR
jgi:hypothetical protein